MSPMEENNYSQQELFEQKKYISDLIDEKSPKKEVHSILSLDLQFYQALSFYPFCIYLDYSIKKKLLFQNQ